MAAPPRERNIIKLFPQHSSRIFTQRKFSIAIRSLAPGPQSLPANHTPQTASANSLLAKTPHRRPLRMKIPTFLTILSCAMLVAASGRDPIKDLPADAAESTTTQTPTPVEYTTSQCSITAAVTTPFESVWYNQTCVWEPITTTVNSVNYEYGCSTYVATTTTTTSD